MVTLINFKFRRTLKGITNVTTIYLSVIGGHGRQPFVSEYDLKLGFIFIIVLVTCYCLVSVMHTIRHKGCLIGEYTYKTAIDLYQSIKDVSLHGLQSFRLFL